MSTNIYEQIWDLDVSKGNGIRAIEAGNTPDTEVLACGYVEVSERSVSDQGRPSVDASFEVLGEPVIPEEKKRSYALVERLFNNYTLDQRFRETHAPTELSEVQEFLEFALNTEVMRLSRAYVEEESGQVYSDDGWWSLIERIWFQPFDMGVSQDLSGFEHVIVGEQKQGKVQGYHFWYKYWLDEHFRPEESAPLRDLISVLGFKGAEERSPEVVTLSFEWNAFDYERRAYRRLTKPIGGFWVGLSVEALLAMGTIRFLPEVKAPRRVAIHGVMYDLDLYRSSDGRHLRTFYPKVLGETPAMP